MRISKMSRFERKSEELDASFDQHYCWFNQIGMDIWRTGKHLHQYKEREESGDEKRR